MKRADGELLDLGEQLARVQPELAKMLRWVDEVWEMYAVPPRDVARRWGGMDVARRCGLLCRPRMCRARNRNWRCLRTGDGRPRRVLHPA